MRPRIAVVGSGVGGLTLAAALAASGTRCEVFEQTRSMTEVGAGVQLAPNAARHLRRLGLQDVLRERAVAVEEMRVYGWEGGRSPPPRSEPRARSCTGRPTTPCTARISRARCSGSWERRRSGWDTG